jgi:DNA-directed RNA polymerase subunit RPC12/RpoP
METTNSDRGRLIRCPKCGKPIAEVGANKISVLKYSQGKPTYITVGVKHDSGGSIDVGCERCGSSFSTVQKTLSMTYVIATPKKKKDVEKPPKSDMV